MSRPSVDELRERLAASLPQAHIHVVDDSHLHAGHAGAAGGAGHFTARLVWAGFDGMSVIARHRLVYDAVRDWMPHRIHALVIEARTPAEAAA